MAKIKCKGTKVQQSIAAIFTDIAQVISIDPPEGKVETYDATALDSSAGKENKITGFVDGGELKFELFMDPALAGFKFMTAQITTPADGQQYKVIFADVGATAWAFSGGGISIGPAVKMNDGLKATVTVKLDGMVTYPA